MRSERPRAALMLGAIGMAVLAAGGCATEEQWATWRAHGTHFASEEHLAFSVRNPEGSSARVTRQDIAMAKDEAWWGQPVTVDQEKILQQ